MTGTELRAIRQRVAPDLSQAAFARLLGYVDGDAYRKYESGARPVPHLLGLLAGMLDRHGVPSEWMKEGE